MFCWKCGTENPEGARFCNKCGADLEKIPETNGVQNKAAGNKKMIVIISVAITAAVVALIVGVVFFARNGIKAPTGSGMSDETGTNTASVEEVKNAKVGDVIKFGSYEQDNNFLNGPEPIEWQVIGTRDGHTLLLSKYALDSKEYNEEWTDITWENCTLRAWLNNDFYNKAFSASDRKKIVTAHNENPDSYELYKPMNFGSYVYGAEGGNATDDQVFLLSWTEARDYLDGKLYDDLGTGNYNQKLLCRPTAYAKAQGVETYSNSDNYYPSDTAGCCWWWLRSPGQDQSSAAPVYYAGALDGHYGYVDYSAVGVRPALLID